MPEQKPISPPEETYERVEPIVLRNMLRVFAGYAPAVLEQADAKKERWFIENLTDEEWIGLARRIQNELDRGNFLPALVLTEILVDFAEERIRQEENRLVSEDDESELNELLEGSHRVIRKIQLQKGLARLQEYEQDLILTSLEKKGPRLYTIADVREWLQSTGAELAQEENRKKVSQAVLQPISNVLAGTANADDAKTINTLIINLELRAYRSAATEYFAKYLYGDVNAAKVFEESSEGMLRLKQFRSVLNEYAKG